MKTAKELFEQKSKNPKRNLVTSKWKVALAVAAIVLVASSGWFYVLAQSSSSSNAFPISSGVYPGAPTFTIFTDGNGSYYAKNAFGVIEFSSTDFASLVNEVFGACPQGSGQGGNPIPMSVVDLAPNENFTVDNTITFPNNTPMCFNGQGDTLYFTPNNNNKIDVAYTTTWDLANEFEIENLFIHVGTNDGGDGIYAQCPYGTIAWFNIYNVVIYRGNSLYGNPTVPPSGTIGIEVMSGGNAQHPTINDCCVFDFAVGIDASIDYCQVQNCLVDYSNSGALQDNGGKTGITFINCQAYECGGACFYVNWHVSMGQVTYIDCVDEGYPLASGYSTQQQVFLLKGSAVVVAIECEQQNPQSGSEPFYTLQSTYGEIGNFTAIDCFIQNNMNPSTGAMSTYIPINVAPTDYPLIDNLIGYWKCNEGQGNTVYDYSKSSNAGTITNATWTQGIYGAGLRFSGNGYVNFGNSALFNVNAFTVGFWVYGSFSGTGKQNFIYKGGSTYSFYAAYQPSSNWLIVSVTNSTGSQWTIGSSSTELTNHAWNFVVCTYNGINTIQVYVNGKNVLKDTNSNPNFGNNGLLVNTNDLVVGRSGDVSSNYLQDAIMNNVMLWNVALDATTIQTLYHSFPNPLAPAEG